MEKKMGQAFKLHLNLALDMIYRMIAKTNKAKEIYENLKSHLTDKYDKIISLGGKDEPNLIKELCIPSTLNFKMTNDNPKGLFGYVEIKPDYILENDPKVVIEFKKIGLYSKKGEPKKNECDIKNALSQIIEQAYCRKLKNKIEPIIEAVLVVFDGGSASDRKWNEEEKKFIQMFKCNPLGVTLSVIRIIINKTNKIEFEMI